jgi:hypothetical protein
MLRHNIEHINAMALMTAGGDCVCLIKHTLEMQTKNIFTKRLALSEVYDFLCRNVYPPKTSNSFKHFICLDLLLLQP